MFTAETELRSTADTDLGNEINLENVTILQNEATSRRTAIWDIMTKESECGKTPDQKILRSFRLIVTDDRIYESKFFFHRLKRILEDIYHNINNKCAMSFDCKLFKDTIISFYREHKDLSFEEILRIITPYAVKFIKSQSIFFFTLTSDYLGGIKSCGVSPLEVYFSFCYPSPDMFKILPCFEKIRTLIPTKHLRYMDKEIIHDGLYIEFNNNRSLLHFINSIRYIELGEYVETF